MKYLGLELEGAETHKAGLELADKGKHRLIILPSLLLFALAGSGCAFAGTYRTLLVLSFFQGVGVAAPGSLNATLIGGVLAAVGWNYPFFLPVLALPVAASGRWV